LPLCIALRHLFGLTVHVRLSSAAVVGHVLDDLGSGVEQCRSMIGKGVAGLNG
jgi:hypothetical protein